MTLSDTASSQLWESFRAGGGAGLVREAVELALQKLIEAEATEAVGAARNERNEARVTVRNGHRPCLSATQAGNVELKIRREPHPGFRAVLGTDPARAGIDRCW